MNFKTTIVLFILILIAVPAAIILPGKLKTTDERQAARGKIFPDFKTAKARRLEVTKGDFHVVFEKKNDTWHITQPLADRADTTKVENILSAIEFLQHRGIVDTKGQAVDPANYGLDKPQAQIAFVGERAADTLLIGKTYEGLGKDSASGKSLYVQPQGDKTIYCVSDDILKDIDQKVVDLRSRTPLDLVQSRITRFELNTSSGTVVVAKDDKAWKLESPVQAAGDTSKITDLINAAISAEKQDFTADDVQDLAQYGLDKPVVSLTFWSEKVDGPRTLLLGAQVPAADEAPEPLEAPGAPGKTEKVYACVEGEKSVFTLKKDAAAKLDVKTADLRDRVITAIKSNDVSSVDITKAGSAISLTKEGWDWKLAAKQGEQEKKADANSSGVQDLLRLFENEKIGDWVDQPDDLAQYGLDEPASIAIKTKAGTEQQSFELLVGKKEGDDCYAKLPDKPWLMKLSGKFADEAAKDYLGFRSKRMLSFSKSSSKKLTLARKSGLVFEVEKIAEDKWSLSKPVAGPAEMSNVNSVLWDISSFDAEKIVSEETADLAPYGLQDPEFTLTVSVDKDGDKPEATHTALIGDQVKDGADYYACLKGGTMLFTVRKSVVDNLRNGFLTLSVMKFEKDDATKLTIARGADQIVCERKDKDTPWAITSPAGQQADSEKIQKLVEALHLLRAAEYIEYTPENVDKYELGAPTLTISVKNDQEKVLRLGKKLSDGSAYARTADATPVFVLNKQSVDAVDRQLADLVKAPDGEKPQDSGDKAAPPDAPPAGEAEPAETAH